MIPILRESSIAQAIMAHWRSAGSADTLIAALPNMGAMGQYGLTPGLPDFLVMAPNLPVGFLEIKTDRGTPTAAQLIFRDRCERLGIPHSITYGRDEPIELLERWHVIRGRA